MRLKELRIRSGLSQRAMAQEFGVSKSTYNYWENEKFEIDIKKLKEIADYFNTSVDYIIEHDSIITRADRQNGWQDTKKESITPLEEDMLSAFRAIGKKFGTETQKAAVSMLENMAGIKK